jgi:hypothetical protein
VRRRVHKAYAAAIAIAVAATASSAALGASSETVVYLASNKAKNISQSECIRRHGCGPEVTAPVILDSAHQYMILVTGTVSVWEFWPKACGKPEARPEFPTRPRNTPTGDDAQFRFGFHLADRKDCRLLPFKSGLFQINLGSGWFHPIAVGNPSQPSADQGDVQHPYTFLVTGHGSEPKFRFVDFHPTDNSGKLKIVLSAAP